MNNLGLLFCIKNMLYNIQCYYHNISAAKVRNNFDITK